MNFKKYPSIENSYQSKFVKSIYHHGFGNHEFVVQEKIHGANFSFITNGTDIVVAKRTGILTENEQFYNHRSVLAKYTENILSLFQAIAKERSIATLTVFGEIFGGGYPHNSVPKDESAQLIQQGIYYSPTNDFFAFDLLLDEEEYLDVSTASSYFEQFGFLYARTLYSGSLQQCLEYSNAFETTVPKELGLPQIEENICEGVIIRPTQPLFLKNGRKVVVKNKNEKWSENNAKIGKEKLNTVLNKTEDFSEEAKDLIEKVHSYISINRLSSVFSKLGEVDPQKDFGRILGLLNKDILSDFLASYKEEYDTLDKQERKAINKYVSKQAKQLLEEYFYN